jgi:hypothetical protein
MISIGLTAVIPVVVAADGADWLVGACAAVAAVLQGVLQVTQDGRVGAEQHSLAVQFSMIMRQYQRTQSETERLRLLQQADDMELMATNNIVDAIRDTSGASR